MIKSGIPDDAAYEWSFGDGGTEKGEEVIHKFAQEGAYTVRVRASWSGGSAESEISIGIEQKAIEKKACERWEIETWGGGELKSGVGNRELICLKGGNYPNAEVEWSMAMVAWRAADFLTVCTIPGAHRVIIK